MRILASLPQYVGYNHNAGAELTMHEMLFALRQRGHNITVLLSDRIAEVDTPFVIDGIKVQPYASKNDLAFHTLETDLVISHLHSAERASLVANLRGIPSVQYIHNTHVTTHQALEANPQLTVFNTDWIQKAFAHRGNSMVLHPAVRPDNYRSTTGGAITLVNLWRNKGVDLFYALAERNPHLSFLGVQGGYEEQQIRELPNVGILPNLADIREAYRLTKVLLMPSAYESYGRCALEAAASGIPTIASPTLGLQEALSGAGYYANAPQTSIPGGDPGPWTDDQIDEWDTALRVVLANYEDHQAQAAYRSAQVWSQTKQELDSFCMKVEGLV